MKIGTYYKLPDGRKGLYVGENALGSHSFSCLDTRGYFEFYNTPYTLEEYREPRVFEDEVLVVQAKLERDGQEPYLIFARNYSERVEKILARMPFKLPEGSGL